MIIFPPDFIKTKYPGYYWNVREKALYSIKVSGALKPLQLSRGGEFNGVVYPDGYRVSVNGYRRFLDINYLLGIKMPSGHESVDVLTPK